MISLLAPLAFVLLQTPAPEPLSYRFEAVKRSVLRWPGGHKASEAKVAVGDAAIAGDIVRTGWWAQAVVAVPERKARFDIQANTQVRLAGKEPGVLLVLDQGRLKAFFQSLVEGQTQERQVAVPGALLAVRGTRYGVEVDKEGRSTLAVFEGVVEILHQVPHAEPIRVKAGEWTTFGPSTLPKAQPMSLRGFEERAWSQGMKPEAAMVNGVMSQGAAATKALRGGPGPLHH